MTLARPRGKPPRLTVEESRHPNSICSLRVNETAFLRIDGLRRSYGSVLALDSVDLTIQRGEFFSLLGPSGCGKTTLLRLIGGLDYPDSGRILLNDTDLATQPANKRPINTVFQTYALFPHLNIFSNVAFGLRMRGVNRNQIKERVDRVMKLVEIESLSSRKPNQLSGGQRQRVALARALVNEPQILLLDEPMAAIDLRLRKQLQTDLRALQQRLGTTFIYVTHDQEEALLMSDRVAVMNAGRIEQIGAPREIYEQPQTQFVAGFLGNSNLLRGRCISRDSQMFLECPIGVLQLNPSNAGNAQNEEPVAVSIRAEQIQFVGGPNQPNSFIGKIARIDYHGANTNILLQIGKDTLLISIKGNEGLALQPGAEAIVCLPPNALRILTR
jgi:spermidine/putrescine transport system ATP-binding protein